jgi:hypothetical protein
MDTLTKAEQSVASLSERDLASFREWFYKFDNQLWDEKMKTDIELGKLDSIASEAIKDFVSGRNKSL